MVVIGSASNTFIAFTCSSRTAGEKPVRGAETGPPPRTARAAPVGELLPVVLATVGVTAVELNRFSGPGLFEDSALRGRTLRGERCAESKSSLPTRAPSVQCFEVLDLGCPESWPATIAGENVRTRLRQSQRVNGQESQVDCGS